MKKILMLLIPLLLLCGCSKGSFKELSYKDFMNKIEKKESFVLFIGANSCSHCATYKTTINEVIKKYNVTIHYVDVDEFTSSQNSELKKIAGYNGTPTTVFIENGKERSSYNRIVGDRDYDYVISKLESNGYIEKVK